MSIPKRDFKGPSIYIKDHNIQNLVEMPIAQPQFSQIATKPSLMKHKKNPALGYSVFYSKTLICLFIGQFCLFWLKCAILGYPGKAGTLRAEPGDIFLNMNPMNT